MAFRPNGSKGKSSSTSSNNFGATKFPVPKAGLRPARISLIVDLGIQEQEDFVNKDGTTSPRKPCHQVAIFADLVRDKVDYGGSIGEAHYRMMLNKQFAGKVQGINFQMIPVRDTEGNLIQGKPWTYPPASLLTKIPKAIGREELVSDDDISKMLNGALNVSVKITEKITDKLDDDGNPIVLKFVNQTGVSAIPPVFDDEGEEKPAVVPELLIPAMCITFDEAKPEDIKYLRSNLIQMIKLAKNYSGSQMQKAIEAFEQSPESFGGFAKSSDTETKSTPAAKPKAANKPKPVPQQTDLDEDSELPY